MKDSPATLCPDYGLASSSDSNVGDIPPERRVVDDSCSCPYGSPKAIHTRRAAGLLHGREFGVPIESLLLEALVVVEVRFNCPSCNPRYCKVYPNPRRAQAPKSYSTVG